MIRYIKTAKSKISRIQSNEKSLITNLRSLMENVHDKFNVCAVVGISEDHAEHGVGATFTEARVRVHMG